MAVKSAGRRGENISRTSRRVFISMKGGNYAEWHITFTKIVGRLKPPIRRDGVASLLYLSEIQCILTILHVVPDDPNYAVSVPHRIRNESALCTTLVPYQYTPCTTVCAAPKTKTSQSYAAPTV